MKEKDKPFVDMYGNEIETGDVITYGITKYNFVAVSIVLGFTPKTVKVLEHWNYDLKEEKYNSKAKSYIRKTKEVLKLSNENLNKIRDTIG